jgi:ABC-type glutathione transport system ATPase component
MGYSDLLRMNTARIASSRFIYHEQAGMHARSRLFLLDGLRCRFIPLVEFATCASATGRARSSTACRFAVPRGKVTALMGASGGGKTTVLR